VSRVSKRARRPSPLNAKQLVFVAEYCANYNASRAARIAGYSQKNSDVAAAKLMKKPHVRAAIDRQLAKDRAARDREWEERQREFAPRSRWL
jgi:phage terminase small subunit